jgi:hypothetical protein
MTERRGNPRNRAYKSGQINPDGQPSIECLVRNLSKAGACLEVDGKLVPQDRFSLVIRPDYLNRRGEVVWRSPQKLGVRFVDPEDETRGTSSARRADRTASTSAPKKPALMPE